MNKSFLLASLVTSATAWAGPSAVVLLQRSVEKHGKLALPDMTEPVEKPAGLLEVVSLEVAELERQLAASEAHNKALLEEKRAEYIAKLEAQVEDQQAMGRRNAELAQDILQLRESNMESRKKADQLLKDTRHLVTNVQALKSNLSDTAGDLVGTIKRATTSEESPALAALEELSAKDKVREAAAAKEARLAELLGKKGASLLQLRAEPMAVATAESVIQELRASLEELNKEANTSLAMLEGSFIAEFASGEHKLKELGAEQDDLIATRQEETALGKRLSDAARHLTDAESRLRKQEHALHSFLSRVSEGAFLKLPAEKHVAKTAAESRIAGRTKDQSWRRQNQQPKRELKQLKEQRKPQKN